jgi:hypothetical protein
MKQRTLVDNLKTVANPRNINVLFTLELWKYFLPYVILNKKWCISLFQIIT